ncbi:COG4705 family protein [Streptacidiphilus albus]|uniref:COG4705 family protein n=1 Tax=Streptacidiphilus albus TaxID=105425 RepID=UPI0005A7F1FD|nr:membrane protein [Streptacidiphilus albus]
MRGSAKASAPGREPLAAKVPEITVLFWVVKILTTGMGEATSDFLANGNPAVAGIVGFGGFCFALWLQFRVRRYYAAVYWLAAVSVAVFGTMVADGVHVALGVPYTGTVTLYAVALAAVLLAWYRSEGTLSIHSITTRRREVFYWCTVLATFALGTALGDFTASTVDLGFLDSAIAFTVLIAVPLVAWWKFRLNAIPAFWFAYVVTRPLGASFADYLGKPGSIGGLGFGDGTVAAVASVAIVALVGYAVVTRNDVQRPLAAAPAPVMEHDPAAARR